MTTQMTDKIHFEYRDDGIAILTFNRPDALNALDLESMHRFKQLINLVAENNAIRVLILTGAGTRAFCSGGDLYDLSHYPSEQDALNFITIMGDTLLQMERLPIPVIGAINGYALGGGSEIAVACDLRIVDDHTRMGFVQIRMGVTPGWGAGQRLLRLVGYPKALDLLLHGHVMHAHELQAMGLANRVVEKGTALEHALYLAYHIIEHDSSIVRSIKTLLQAGLNHPYEDALRIERELFPPLWAGESHKRAVDEFLQKQLERQAGRKGATP